MNGGEKTIPDESEFDDHSERKEELSAIELKKLETIASLQKSLNSLRIYSASFDALQQITIRQSEILSGIANAIPKFTININPIVTGLSNLMVSDALVNSMKTIQNSYSAIYSAFQSPVFKWIQSLDLSPIYETLRKFADYAIDFDKIKEIYLQELYDAHWFPYTCWHAELSFTGDILEAIRHTKKSKNRVKKIDRIVFDYYTDDVVEMMKKDWRKLELPEYLMRILHQAVQAYHRKEYAISVIVLSTQWEGIIYSKAHDVGRKRTERTKKHLMALIEENNYLDIFQSYFDEFIMYNCNSSDETIKDVPGRNSAAHSFYDSYPTRKAALNAILFTDFLLNLQPMEEEEEDG